MTFVFSYECPAWNRQAILILKVRGANSTIRDLMGMTPTDYAVQSGSDAIKQQFYPPV